MYIPHLYALQLLIVLLLLEARVEALIYLHYKLLISISMCIRAALIVININWLPPYILTHTITSHRHYYIITPTLLHHHTYTITSSHTITS